jgi:hypothetical protein
MEIFSKNRVKVLSLFIMTLSAFCVSNFTAFGTASIPMIKNPDWEWDISGNLENDTYYYWIEEKIVNNSVIEQDWEVDYFGVGIVNNYNSTYEGNETDVLDLQYLIYNNNTRTYEVNTSKTLEIHFNETNKIYAMNYSTFDGYLSPNLMLPFVLPLNVSGIDRLNVTLLSDILINDTANSSTLNKTFGIDNVVNVDEVNNTFALNSFLHIGSYYNATFNSSGILESALINVTTQDINGNNYTYYWNVTKLMFIKPQALIYENRLGVYNESLYGSHVKFDMESPELVFQNGSYFIEMRANESRRNEWNNTWEFIDNRSLGVSNNTNLSFSNDFLVNFIFPIGTNGEDVIDLFSEKAQFLDIRSSNGFSFDFKSSTTNNYLRGSLTESGILFNLTFFIQGSGQQFNLVDIDPLQLIHQPENFSESINVDDYYIYHFLDNTYQHEYGCFRITDIGEIQVQHPWGKFNMSTINSTFYKWSETTRRWTNVTTGPFGYQIKYLATYWQDEVYLPPTSFDVADSFYNLVVNDREDYFNFIKNVTFGYFNFDEAVFDQRIDRTSYTMGNSANATQYLYMEFNSQGILTEFDANITGLLTLHMVKIGSVVLPNNGLPTINLVSYINLTSEDGGVNIFVGVNNPDGNGDVRVLWDFGDGTTEEGGFAITHVYENNGTYTVKIRVIDPNWDEVTTTIDVTILIGDQIGGDGEPEPEPQGLAWWIWTLIVGGAVAGVSILVFYLQRAGIIKIGRSQDLPPYDEKLSLEECGEAGFIINDDGECIPFQNE